MDEEDDKDTSGDSFIGEVAVPLEPICKEPRVSPRPITLDLISTADSKHKKNKEPVQVSGKISLELIYTPLSSDILNATSKQQAEIPKSEFANDKTAIEERIKELRKGIDELDAQVRQRQSADGYKATSYVETVFFFFVKLFLIVWNLALILHIAHLFLNA